MQVNQKNWQELIKPNKLHVEPGADPQRTATAVAEPLERAVQRRTHAGCVDGQDVSGGAVGVLVRLKIGEADAHGEVSDRTQEAVRAKEPIGDEIPRGREVPRGDIGATISVCNTASALAGSPAAR